MIYIHIRNNSNNYNNNSNDNNTNTDNNNNNNGNSNGNDYVDKLIEFANQNNLKVFGSYLIKTKQTNRQTDDLKSTTVK